MCTCGRGWGAHSASNWGDGVASGCCDGAECAPAGGGGVHISPRTGSGTPWRSGVGRNSTTGVTGKLPGLSLGGSGQTGIRNRMILNLREWGIDADVSRARDLIGLSVLASPDMRPVGRVQEVLISRDGRRIRGLVLETGGLLSRRRVLDYQGVKAVGSTYVLAEERYLEDEAETRCGSALTGLPVLDGSGEELGMLDDLHFEPSTGEIHALQLSRGFVDDLLSGKAIVPLNGPAVTGEGAILLDAVAEREGGLWT
ncbi:MAG: hypothetical protein CWE10_15085 [Symbiobacterium thermophilum]|uniref:PRC-barrel domain-containing protein n=2 Tax=Symbiobacterium thermophilum TaxID=2734 RepID=A0A953LKX1_SYMTR|nr:hypothetical protein [Symbiobacterium thermophilum]